MVWWRGGLAGQATGCSTGPNLPQASSASFAPGSGADRRRAKGWALHPLRGQAFGTLIPRLQRPHHHWSIQAYYEP